MWRVEYNMVDWVISTDDKILLEDYWFLKKKKKKTPKLEKSDEQLEKLDEYDVFYSSVSVSREFFSLDIELRKDNDNGIE